MSHKLNLTKIVYFISRAFFYCSIVFISFIIVFSLLSFIESNSSINIPLVESSEVYTKVIIPFMRMHVEFQNSLVGFSLMSLSLIFYALYFYSLSNFFNVFTKTNLFTDDSIQKLKFFSKLNILPLVIALITILIDQFRGVKFKMDSEYGLVAFHFLIAILVYFYLDLIKKGKLIKDDNDLTI